MGAAEADLNMTEEELFEYNEERKRICREKCRINEKRYQSRLTATQRDEFRERVQKQVEENRASGRFRCEICDYSAPRVRDLNQHLSTAKHKERARVLEGGVPSTTHKALLGRQRVERAKENKTFRCQLCDYTAGTKGDLDKHFRSPKHLNAVTESGKPFVARSDIGDGFLFGTTRNSPV
jgi:hypothetical protein